MVLLAALGLLRGMLLVPVVVVPVVLLDALMLLRAVLLVPVVVVTAVLLVPSSQAWPAAAVCGPRKRRSSLSATWQTRWCCRIHRRCCESCCGLR